MANKKQFLIYMETVEQRLADLKEGLDALAQTDGKLDESSPFVHEVLEKARGFMDSMSAKKINVMAVTREILNEYSNMGSVDANTTTTPPAAMFLSASTDAPHAYVTTFPLAVFIVTAMACMGFSAIYHLFLCVSPTWMVRFQCLDFAGICLLIVGSIIPIIHYGFFCSPTLQMAYSLAVVLLGAICFLIVIALDNEWRVLKTLAFITLAVVGAIPVMHVLVQEYDGANGGVLAIAWFILMMGSLYLVGAAIYIAQVPERWAPGKFDHYCASHQLWHLCICAAVLVHYVGLIDFFKWRMMTQCSV
jgi:adiponectin receptor